MKNKVNVNKNKNLIKRLRVNSKILKFYKNNNNKYNKSKNSRKLNK